MKHQHYLSRRGFTLVELLVVIVIIVAIAGLAFVGIPKFRESGRRAVSTQNLRQIGVGFMGFMVDNNGKLPAAAADNRAFMWPDLIYPYASNTNIFARPGMAQQPLRAGVGDGWFEPDGAAVSSKTPEGVIIRYSYCINGGGERQPFQTVDPTESASITSRIPYSRIPDPGQIIFMTDGPGAQTGGWWINRNTIAEAAPRMYKWSNGRTNVLWGDGSITTVAPSSLRDSNLRRP